MTTDPIADLLTRIRNAMTARHETVNIPASTMKESLLKILKERRYIESFVREEGSIQDNLKVFLKYKENRQSVIRELRRVSKPGRRVYVGYRELRPYLRGVGLRILSTPKGLMTDFQAREAKLGGEVLCELY